MTFYIFHKYIIYTLWWRTVVANEGGGGYIFKKILFCLETITAATRTVLIKSLRRENKREALEIHEN